MKYDKSTPFLSQDLSHLAANNEAFRKVLRFLPEQPRTITEAFGGIGSQSKILQQTFPGAELHTAFELDPACYTELLALPGIAATLGRFRENPDPSELLVADCNDFSLAKTKLERYSEIVDSKSRWLILTDIARGKLHINFAAYGLPSKSSYKDYATKLSETLNRSLLGFEECPKSLTYIALERK